jgi:hypothetical protein
MAMHGFKAHFKPERFQHALERAQPRIPVRRQGFMKSLAADGRIASKLCNPALRLRHQPKRIEQGAHVTVLFEFLQGQF